MATLWEKINDDMKAALKGKRELELATVRMVLAAVKNKKIALNKGTSPDPLTDAEILDVIGSEIKKRKDSVEAYQAGGRTDLVEREQAEIGIIEKYLPAQMADADLEKVVKEAIGAAGAVSLKDAGRVIGQVMPQVRGQADGSRVSEIVKRLLS